MRDILTTSIMVVMILLISSGPLYSNAIDDNRDKRLGNDHSSLMPVSYMNSTKARADSIIKRLDSAIWEKTVTIAEDTEELPLAANQRKVADVVQPKPPKIVPEAAITTARPVEDTQQAINSGRETNEKNEPDKPSRETAIPAVNPKPNAAIGNKIPEISPALAPDNGDMTNGQEPLLSSALFSIMPGDLPVKGKDIALDKIETEETADNAQTPVDKPETASYSTDNYQEIWNTNAFDTIWAQGSKLWDYMRQDMTNLKESGQNTHF